MSNSRDEALREIPSSDDKLNMTFTDKLSDSDSSPLSPRSRKLQSSPVSSHIQTDSRFIRRSSHLRLDDLDVEIGAITQSHTVDQLDTEHSAPAEVKDILSPRSPNSHASYASTVGNTPQTAPLPASPLTGQSTSPNISPRLEANADSPVLSPSSPISPVTATQTMVMPDDPDVIKASLPETKMYSEVIQNKLIDSIIEEKVISGEKANNEQAKKKIVESFVSHIWEENLEILSFARYKRPFGIYYTHGLNKTVIATGRSVRNLETHFSPQNVAFLTQYGPNANFSVASLQELDPKSDECEDFVFDNALIFMPICYTARHALTHDDFFNALKYFAIEKKCDITVYLGRDAGLEENKKKRDVWLAENIKYIDQVKNTLRSNPDNKKIPSITIQHRSELVLTPEYLYTEYYFTRQLGNKKNIISAIKKDVIKRLEQKQFLEVPTKAIPIKKPSSPNLPSSSPRPSPRTIPQLGSPLAQIQMRPHSYPDSLNINDMGFSSRITDEEKKIASSLLNKVINSDRAEDIEMNARLAKSSLLSTGVSIFQSTLLHSPYFSQNRSASAATYERPRSANSSLRQSRPNDYYSSDDEAADSKAMHAQISPRRAPK